MEVHDSCKFFLYQHRCINIWLPCTTLLNLKSLSLYNLYCTHTPPTPSLVMCILTIIGTVQCTHVHCTHTHQAAIPVCTLVQAQDTFFLNFIQYELADISVVDIQWTNLTQLPTCNDIHVCWDIWSDKCSPVDIKTINISQISPFIL